MTDEVVVEETEAETGEQSTGSNQTKKQETFTQEQVNKILAKEKATWKRSADKEKEALSGAEAELREKIIARDAVIQKSVDLLKQDMNIDEDFQELLNGMDVLAQYEWLLKKAEKAGKQDIPRTPQSQGDAIKSSPFRRRQTV